MKITIKLYQLRNLAYAPQGQTPLLERLYAQKPERGGSKIAYRIAGLRATVVRLLGDGSALEEQRKALLDEHFEPETPEGRKPKNGPESFKAFEDALLPLWDITEEIDAELFSVEQLDAAGYCLSGAEIDALMGLLIQPEATPEPAPTA